MYRTVHQGELDKRVLVLFGFRLACSFTFFWLLYFYYGFVGLVGKGVWACLYAYTLESVESLESLCRFPYAQRAYRVAAVRIELYQGRNFRVVEMRDFELQALSDDGAHEEGVLEGFAEGVETGDLQGWEGRSTTIPLPYPMVNPTSLEPQDPDLEHVWQDQDENQHQTQTQTQDYPQTHPHNQETPTSPPTAPIEWTTSAQNWANIAHRARTHHEQHQRRDQHREQETAARWTISAQHWADIARRARALHELEERREREREMAARWVLYAQHWSRILREVKARGWVGVVMVVGREVRVWVWMRMQILLRRKMRDTVLSRVVLPACYFIWGARM